MTQGQDWRPYPDASEIRTHWYGRTQWEESSSFFTWHLVLNDQAKLCDIAAVYQESIRRFDFVDIVPLPWLHLTVQGVANSRRLSVSELLAISEAVSHRLGMVESPTGVFGAAVIHREAVVCPPRDPEPFLAVRDAIRMGIGDVWGVDNIPEQVSYRPHFSVAYLNGPGDINALRESLDSARGEDVTASFESVSLLELHRGERSYTWDLIKAVRIG